MLLGVLLGVLLVKTTSADRTSEAIQKRYRRPAPIERYW